ncbi:MAG: hypothetical protein ACK5AZ_17960 [Bryobacteraceae bacterium]
MTNRLAALLFVAAVTLPVSAGASEPTRPKAGKAPIMKSSELKPGMQGTAWTVFTGTEPEPIPVEIIGLWKNAWGPQQDIIIAKMGGKAQRTNVAGGMSGSPVYIDGKLIGAVALRMSVFSPDAICGITPIELMLEINDFDTTRPADAKVPDQPAARNSLAVPGDLLQQVMAAGRNASIPPQAIMTPIETPLTFSGFHDSVLKEFGPLFHQMGVTAVQGGAGGNLRGPAPAQGWQDALQPGDSVAGVLVSGDMNITGLGTVTYNDGKRVLAFGHPFFNLGPVSMPMSKGEVLMVLSSQFQPNKFANATEVVGALKQDRHSGIMGELGASADMIPVNVTVRTFADSNNLLLKEKQLTFNVFVHQKWTPYLMMVTLFNSISGLNDFADEATYRLSGEVELEGHDSLSLSTMLAPGEMPVPAPMLLAGWWGDKFNRLFLNAVKTPRLRSVNATIDLIPERRVAGIETAWTASSEVEAGADVPVKVFLRPYRGERIEREFTITLPSDLPKGDHRILLSDADTLNRIQSAAGMMNRYIDLPQTVSLINQERSNNQLYVSLVQARPTVYYEDKTMPSLPASVLNVMQAGRSASRPLVASAETAREQMTIPFDFVINGSYSLKITVK